jgi:hypothetical protein
MTVGQTDELRKRISLRREPPRAIGKWQIPYFVKNDSVCEGLPKLGRNQYCACIQPSRLGSKALDERTTTRYVIT